MKPNVSSSSTFPWRGEEKSLATHGDVEMEEICVRIHGEEEEAERFWWENGEEDERKVRENEMKREKDMSQMKLVRD